MGLLLYVSQRQNKREHHPLSAHTLTELFQEMLETVH